MSPAVETGNRPQVESVVLEPLCNRLRQGAPGVHRDSDEVALAMVNGFLQGAFRGLGPPFTIGDNSIPIAHKDQRPIIVQSVQSRNLGTYASME